jgi:Kef-type K+ transport system membrane component KefB
MQQIWHDAALWLLLALIASLISLKLGVSVALVELLVGILAGNTGHPPITDWVQFLSGFGAVLLTFLAGTELESAVLKRYWRQSLAIGFVSFLAPFLVCFAVARFLLHWEMSAAWIAGIALSTTSVAVVYAVMLETGLNEKPLGKLILAACFITDLGTVLALGLMFCNFDRNFWVLCGILCLALPLLWFMTPRYFAWVGSHVSEPEVKLLLLALAALGFFAVKGGSEAVLPAYLLGMVLADSFLKNKELIRRLRATTFALLTPIYFIKAGSLVDLRAAWAGLGLLALFFCAKVGAKALGVYPVASFFHMKPRTNIYTTLLMSTGLTFGTISALYGLSHEIITRGQYSILVLVVILTAIIPTLFAQRFFLPRGEEAHV